MREIASTLRARDVMTTKLITIPIDASMEETAALLVDSGISGAPVRDEFGRIVGLVSLRDIARYTRERLHDRVAQAGEAEGAGWDAEASQRRRKGTERRRGFHLEGGEPSEVREFMTPVVFAVPQDSPIEAVVRAMLDRKVHRVLVGDSDGEIVGLISAIDLIRAISAPGPA